MERLKSLKRHSVFKRTDKRIFLEQSEEVLCDLYLTFQCAVSSLSVATVHCLVTETTIRYLSHTPLLRAAVE